MASDTFKVLAHLRRADRQEAAQWVRRQSKILLARSGYLVTRMDAESRRYVLATHSTDVPLPPGAAEYLRADNPRLQELQRAYDDMNSPATSATQWTSGFLRRNLSLAWFRGDNAYVWQFRHMRGAADARMYLSLLDVQSRDGLGLLGKLTEDGAFGAWTFRYGDRPPVSRDLLDSVNELNYLHARTGLADLPGLRVLDIGAGYGRLAHRTSAAFDNLAAYDCVDGVAVSTFLCEYYVGHRALPDSVRVVPVHEHQKLGDRYDVAVNIHSFSECAYDTIAWWFERIAERRIEWLLIVPNTETGLLSTELDGSHRDFEPLVTGAGYELVDSRWVNESDELRALIEIRDKFYLYRRPDAAR